MTGRPRTALNHGDYNFAQRNRCPCDPCRTTVRRCAKRWKLMRDRGVSLMVDAQPIREHVLRLLEMGAQPNQIINAAGIVHAVYDSLLVGRMGKPPALMVRPETAERLRSVTLARALAQPTLLPSIGVRRRFDALRAIGHGPRVIADELGVSVAQLYMYAKAERSESATIERFHAAYVALRNVEGTSPNTLWRGRREQWPTPWCWDDETIDDPDAEPGERVCLLEGCGRGAYRMTLCVQHYQQGRQTRRIHESPQRYRWFVGNTRVTDSNVIQHDIADLAEFGMSATEIVRHLGLARSTVDKALSTGSTTSTQPRPEIEKETHVTMRGTENHTLRGDGCAFVLKAGGVVDRQLVGGKNAPGRALCSCGAVSDTLADRPARLAWLDHHIKKESAA